MDHVQTPRAGSTEPQRLRKLDRIKKTLEEDRGYLSDGGKVRSHNSSQAVRDASPELPFRAPHVLHSPHASPTQRVSPSPQSSPLTTHPSPPSSMTASNGKPKKILFYHANDPHYGFTNFSPDPIQYNGKTYQTSEHLFQSLKFMKHRPELAEHIRTCSTRPRVVFDETHRFNPEVRTDWLQVRVEMMDLVLWHKFTQNRHLKKELLSTGDAELVEDSDKDSFWGVGADRKGQNQLGKALEAGNFSARYYKEISYSLDSIESLNDCKLSVYECMSSKKQNVKYNYSDAGKGVLNGKMGEEEGRRGIIQPYNMIHIREWSIEVVHTCLSVHEVSRGREKFKKCDQGKGQLWVIQRLK
ncbi:DUF1768-domain-containing protein [Rhizopogon salebrosus TDB-379]|nr:DUF1768-domain-containing protein [Rhizopogon salebrosus TDB-379]